MIKQMSFNYMG